MVGFYRRLDTASRLVGAVIKTSTYATFGRPIEREPR